jgi:hypothetical protein
MSSGFFCQYSAKNCSGVIDSGKQSGIEVIDTSVFENGYEVNSKGRFIGRFEWFMIVAYLMITVRAANQL